MDPPCVFGCHFGLSSFSADASKHPNLPYFAFALGLGRDRLDNLKLYSVFGCGFLIDHARRQRVHPGRISHKRTQRTYKQENECFKVRLPPFDTKKYGRMYFFLELSFFVFVSLPSSTAFLSCRQGEGGPIKKLTWLIKTMAVTLSINSDKYKIILNYFISFKSGGRWRTLKPKSINLYSSLTGTHIASFNKIIYTVRAVRVEANLPGTSTVYSMLYDNRR